MGDTLQEYLEKRGAKPIEPEFFDEYKRLMREEVLPEIERNRREQARLYWENLHKGLF